MEHRASSSSEGGRSGRVAYSTRPRRCRAHRGFALRTPILPATVREQARLCNFEFHARRHLVLADTECTRGPGGRQPFGTKQDICIPRRGHFLATVSLMYSTKSRPLCRTTKAVLSGVPGFL